MVGVTQGCEVQPGAGEEAAEEAGPVLHPPEPGLDQRGQLAEVALGSSSKQIQAPRSAAVLLPPAGSPPATGQSPPHPAPRPGGPGPARSTRSGAATLGVRGASSPKCQCVLAGEFALGGRS